MKKAINKLNAIGFNMDHFYCVTIWENEIRLQGKFNKELFDALESEGFSFDFRKDAKWFEASLNGIVITLTL